LPPEFIAETDQIDGVSVLMYICEKVIEAFVLWVPNHNLSHTKGFTFHEPFDLKSTTLLFGKLGNEGLKITILTGFESLTVFTIGIDHMRVEIRFASHNQEAAVTRNVSQVSEIEVTAVR